MTAPLARLFQQQQADLMQRIVASRSPIMAWCSDFTPQPLDTASDETFAKWCATPVSDTRTLEEFAADGGERR